MTQSTSNQTHGNRARVQRSFAGMCIALLLVGGLLSMPTTCDCGAGVPHGHSLFILAGHHHGADGISFGLEREDHTGHHHLESPQSEPQLRGHVSHYSDRMAVAVPAFEIAAQTWQPISAPASGELLPAGRVDRPEVPPPRTPLSG